MAVCRALRAVLAGDVGGKVTTTEDSLIVDQMLDSPGWERFQRMVNVRIRYLEQRLVTTKFADLAQVQVDQAEVRFLRKLAGDPKELLKFLAVPEK